MVECNLGVKDSNGDVVKIPATETHLVHVIIENKTFNRATGAKTSKPMLQSFYPSDFDQMAGITGGKDKRNYFGSTSIVVAHDPRRQKSSGKKQLSDMTEKELREEFKEEFGRAASEDETRETLIHLIGDNRS